MIAPPKVRKLTLTAHVVASVGWLGTIVAFLGLAVIGMTSGDAETVRGAYLAMHPLAVLTLVPLAFATIVTGLVQSIVTRWGLFRHYWVVFKLGIAVVATAVLLLYMATFRELARLAADPSTELADVRNASPLLHAVAAFVLLVVAVVLAVYKPRGVTPYGRRKANARARNGSSGSPS